METKPSTTYANTTASVISRKLKAAGFRRFSAKYSPFGYDKQDEGFRVYRLGCSKLVSFYWASTHNHFPLETKKQREAEIAAAIRGMGYELDEKNHIACEHSGE